jgi:hypothetical protein
MALVKCNTCGAEYRTVQRDGASYFHVCPPQIIVRARKEDGTEIEQPLEQFAGLTIVENRQQRDELVNSNVDPATIVLELRRRTVRRADHRDENTRRRDGDRGEIRVLRSEGKGVTVLRSDTQVTADDNAGV